MEYLKVKRVIDLVLSVLAAVILLPVFLILFIAIKLDSQSCVCDLFSFDFDIFGSGFDSDRQYDGFVI